MLLKNASLYKGVLYDLGCGSAPYRDFFLQFVDQYVGVDWAQSYHDIKADVVADLNKPIPVESEVADTVVSISVLEHLYAPQVMIEQAYRILKPNGNMLLQVPWQWAIHEEPHDYFRYSPFGLKYLFEKAGFTDVVVEPQSGFCTMWVLKANYFSSRFIRGPRPIRWLIRVPLVILWSLGQCIAPLVDQLDRNWLLESTGYYVTARKPRSKTSQGGKAVV
jgi:SAM-dependent methyltransferase